MEDADIAAQNEERVDGLLRQAHRARRSGNDQECEQRLSQARTILQRLGAEISFEQRDRDTMAQNDRRRTTARVGPGGGRIVVEETQPQVNVTQPEPQVDVTQQPLEVLVRQPQPEVIVRQPALEVSVRQAQPQVTVHQEQLEIIVRIPRPIVTIKQPEADVDVQTSKPQVQVSDAQPKVRYIRPEPRIVVEDAEDPAVNVKRAEIKVNIRRSGETNENVRIEREKAKVRFERASDPTATLQWSFEFIV